MGETAMLTGDVSWYVDAASRRHPSAGEGSDLEPLFQSGAVHADSSWTRGEVNGNLLIFGVYLVPSQLSSTKPFWNRLGT